MAVKNVFEVLILLSFVMGSLCYVYIIPGEMGKSKDHEDYCLYNDTQSLIKRGESMIMPATCEEVSCGDDYTMQILGCGSFSLHDPSCIKWERDFSKPYPKCCTSFICVEFAKHEIDLDAVDKNTLD